MKKNDKLKNVTIMGGGVLGAQIAFQTAYSGFNVKIWLRSPDSITRTKQKIDKLKDTYIKTIKLMNTKEGKTFANWCRGIADYDNFSKEECLKKVDKAYNSIKYELDIESSLKNADLVIESMTEDFNAKKDLYIKMSPFIQDKTIVVTNSSTMLPSRLAKYTGCKERFLALHFANSIWKNNTAEVMKHKDTQDVYFDKVISFAKEINMIPLTLHKEKAGYLLNSMLIPLLFSGLDLYVNGISDPESIDSAWTLGTGAPKGPFRILDTVGLKTAHEIVLSYVKIPSFMAPYNFKGMEKLLKKYIDEGKLGESTGEGFYKYSKSGEKDE